MKKVISVFLIISFIFGFSVRANTAFYDLSTHSWAAASIYRLADKGVIQGIAPHYYAPGNYVSKAQLCTLLNRMFGIGGNGLSAFPDVPENSYYYESVAGLKALGILTTTDGMFHPDDAVNREETMRITGFLLQRFGFVSYSDESCLERFADRDLISPENRQYTALLISKGYITGDDTGNLNPDGYLTRAEIAVLLDRMYSDIMQE